VYFLGHGLLSAGCRQKVRVSITNCDVYLSASSADRTLVSTEQTTMSATEAASAQNVLVSALRGEIARLREALAAEQERARVAESQLARVHRAVRAAQTSVRDVKDQRNRILTQAQQHASQIVQQAKDEAHGISSRSTSAYSGFGERDASLDERLDEYLQAEMEPDASRNWILGDRSN